MNRFAVSTMFAGCLVAGALSLSVPAQATELNVGPDGVGITAVDGGGIMVGPGGVTAWMPDEERYGHRYDGHRYDGRYGRDYDRHYGMHAGVANPCYPDYCVR